MLQNVNVKINGLGHSEVVDILKFDSFGTLKSCGGRMHGSQAYTIRWGGWKLIWVSYRPQQGGGGR